DSCALIFGLHSCVTLNTFSSPEASTSMPSPGPVGADPRPPTDRGEYPATCPSVQSFMNEAFWKFSGRVLAARWLTAAVTISPPQESSTETIIDRKSTRLNSSHVKSTYAVFSLKKK